MSDGITYTVRSVGVTGTHVVLVWRCGLLIDMSWHHATSAAAESWIEQHKAERQRLRVQTFADRGQMNQETA